MKMYNTGLFCAQPSWVDGSGPQGHILIMVSVLPPHTSNRTTNPKVCTLQSSKVEAFKNAVTHTDLSQTLHTISSYSGARALGDLHDLTDKWLPAYAGDWSHCPGGPIQPPILLVQNNQVMYWCIVT